MFIEVTSDMVMPGPVIGEKIAETGVKAMLGEWMVKMRQKLLRFRAIPFAFGRNPAFLTRRLC